MPSRQSPERSPSAALFLVRGRRGVGCATGTNSCASPNRSGTISVTSSPGMGGRFPARICSSICDDRCASSIAPSPASMICWRNTDCLRPVTDASNRSRCAMAGSSRTPTTSSLFSPALLKILPAIKLSRARVCRPLAYRWSRAIRTPCTCSTNASTLSDCRYVVQEW